MSLIPVEEAIARIVAGIAPLPSESLALADAAGRVLAEALLARRTQPPFAASAMDGYALRAADGSKAGARLNLIGEAHAGKRFAGIVGAGECVRIFTGAPLPEGADAILIQENAERIETAIVIVRQSVIAGRHIRAAGLDFRQGETRLAPGKRLSPRDLALAASMNYPRLAVRRRPIIAFFATGDELVAPGEAAGPDQIVASNSIGLAALIAEAGGVPRDLGIVRDDAKATEGAIVAGLAGGADILVTLGGASVGERDLVRGALAAKGMALDFWKIAMRPGMPLIFGRLGAVPVIGLPGNPVSSLVCALLFLRPLISAMLGVEVREVEENALTGADLPANDQRQEYLRAKLSAESGSLPLATPLSLQDSSALSALSAADCLLIRTPNAPALPAGSLCRIIRLS